MKLLGLQAVIRKKRYKYKPHIPYNAKQNLLNRQFNTKNPMEKLLTDITEFKYGQNSKAYLSAILDLGSNKIIAYQLSNKNDNHLVKNTVEQLLPKIKSGKTMIHSDRGYQYTSNGFNQFVQKQVLIHSMSRVVKCIDNSPMKNFWGILKEEMYRLNTYRSYEDLRKDIKKYIHFFNSKRITLNRGLKIPTQKTNPGGFAKKIFF